MDIHGGNRPRPPHVMSSGCPELCGGAHALVQSTHLEGRGIRWDEACLLRLAMDGRPACNGAIVLAHSQALTHWLTRDIMRLNHTLGELNNNDFERYSEWFYWITVMGTPSATEPWGWQLDGHDAIINYFVFGDQVVMTPTFFGSEPVRAHAGRYQGTTVLQDEQNQGLAMINALTDAQRAKAIVHVSKTGNNIMAQAFKDNLVLEYVGIRASKLAAEQQIQLLALIHAYVRNMDDGHATVKMAEVERYLDHTHFAWIGGTEPTSVFYYRIQSPVILLEFDHQLPVGLRHLASDPQVDEGLMSLLQFHGRAGAGELIVI
jgi:hypothetical protein